MMKAQLASIIALVSVSAFAVKFEAVKPVKPGEKWSDRPVEARSETIKEAHLRSEALRAELAKRAELAIKKIELPKSISLEVFTQKADRSKAPEAPETQVTPHSGRRAKLSGTRSKTAEIPESVSMVLDLVAARLAADDVGKATTFDTFRTELKEIVANEMAALRAENPVKSADGAAPKIALSEDEVALIVANRMQQLLGTVDEMGAALKTLGGEGFAKELLESAFVAGDNLKSIEMTLKFLMDLEAANKNASGKKPDSDEVQAKLSAERSLRGLVNLNKAYADAFDAKIAEQVVGLTDKAPTAAMIAKAHDAARDSADDFMKTHLSDLSAKEQEKVRNDVLCCMGDKRCKS